MQLSSPRKKSLINLTPLIDIVFILLIFFMLASNFVRWHTLELSVGEASEIEIDPLAISIISIKADASYAINKTPMALNEIISLLRSKINNDPDHPIVIQPEKGTNVQAMVDILNIVKGFAGNSVSVAKPITENL